MPPTVGPERAVRMVVMNGSAAARDHNIPYRYAERPQFGGACCCGCWALAHLHANLCVKMGANGPRRLPALRRREMKNYVLLMQTRAYANNDASI